MAQDALNSETVDKFFETGGEEAPVIESETQDHQEPAENAPQDEITEKASDERDEQKEPPETEITRNLKAALAEERTYRKELQQKEREWMQEKQRMNEAFQRYLEQTQRQPEPSFDDDPIEAARYKLQQHEQYLQQLHQTEIQRQQQAHLYQQQQAFANQCNQAVQEFTQKAPDYVDAANYLSQTMLNEYQALGYDAAQANRILQEEAAAAFAKAFQDGANPAERIYNFAKMRGYQGKVVEPKLDQIAKTVNASKSLSNASGKATKAGFSLSDLANLSQQEINELVKNDWGKIEQVMS